MTTRKPKRDNSVLFIVLGVVALFVGGTMVLMAANTDDGGEMLVGFAIIIAGIVLLVLAFIQYGKNVKTVAGVVMGAAAKIQTQGAQAAPVADQIARLTELHNSGSLSDEEFTAAKAKVLNR